MSKAPAVRKASTSRPQSPKYESAKLEGIYPVLDGIAWLDAPSTSELSQFSGLDNRTVGKLLKNSQNLGIVEKVHGGYVLLSSYPYEGTAEQKASVVKEALFRLPLLKSMRQFISLGDNEQDALRKAATLCKYVPFSASDFAPLLSWAGSLGALKAGVVTEDLVVDAEAEKVVRHAKDKNKVVAFLSHSSKDKAFVRQLASDLDAAGVSVWLDEQRIKVGESIPELVSQGLASSDYFLIVISKNSIESEWVKKELNSALLTEVQKRQVHILPIRTGDVTMPHSIADKRYADFASSYRQGLSELLAALGSERDGE